MNSPEPIELPPVWILTFGSLGDVLPLAALGQELARRGHAVTLWCGSLHLPMVEQMGMHAVAVETDALPSLRLHARTLFKVPLMWRRVEQAMRISFSDMASRLANHPVAVPRPIVVASTFALAGRLAQEKLGLRLATVHLSPMCMASFLDMPVIRGLSMPACVPRALRPPLGRGLERLLFDPVASRGVNALRSELGLAPVSHVFSRWLHSKDLVLGLFPDWFGVPQPDWPVNTCVLGFPMADGAGNLALSPQDIVLERFLAEGSPPVVFYPGSAKRDTRAFFDEALGTCERLGLRAIFLTRYRTHVAGGTDLPKWALYQRYAPLGSLLPRVAALVHCGGVGTLAQAVAAGCPQLVLPNHYDQFDNAHRLQRLHLAVSHRGSGWEQALQSVLNDASLAKACHKKQADLVPGADVLSRAADLVAGLCDSPASSTG